MRSYTLTHTTHHTPTPQTVPRIERSKAMSIEEVNKTVKSDRETQYRKPICLRVEKTRNFRDEE